MFNILPIAGAVVVAVAGYLGLNAASIIGNPAVLSEEEVTAGLASYADQINAEGGLRFDDFSKLVSATAMSQKITIRGESLLDMEEVSEGYHTSRVDQGLNILCNDETLLALLGGRATMNFNWFSADRGSIGDLITVRGDEECAIHDS